MHTILCTYNFAFVGEFIAGLVKYSLSPFAGTAACVALSVKTHFSGHVKIRLFHNWSIGYLKFSKNCLNILMAQQF